MSDKKETISFRVTKEMRADLKEWMEEQGYDSEADALRGMIRQTVREQETLEEMQADERIMEKLEEIETEIERIDRPLWERLFEEER